MAQSNYLNQYWLIIDKILCHSQEGIFTGNAPYIYPWYEVGNLGLVIQNPILGPRKVIWWSDVLQTHQGSKADQYFGKILLFLFNLEWVQDSFACENSYAIIFIIKIKEYITNLHVMKNE